MGRCIYLRGSIYEGQWLNGEFDGYGRLIYWDGSYHQGFFKTGYAEGEGTRKTMLQTGD